MPDSNWLWLLASGPISAERSSGKHQHYLNNTVLKKVNKQHYFKLNFDKFYKKEEEATDNSFADTPVWR